MKGLKTDDRKISNYFYGRLQHYALNRFGKNATGQQLLLLQESISDAYLVLRDKIKMGAFREASKLEPYAFTVLKYTYFDANRKNMRARCYTPKELPEIPFTDTPYITSADQLFDLKDNFLLWRWYHSLNPRDQTLLDLRSQGCDYKEIAKETNLALGTVRNIFHRLLKKARSMAA